MGSIRAGAWVVGAITPFNFSLNLVAHKLGPAITAGCPVICKPADRTPLTAVVRAELLQEAGLPAGWSRSSPGMAPVREQRSPATQGSRR
jgi:acyl-CoA reductase-like NAD-dependent aldehyde dehydrogenase